MKRKSLAIGAVLVVSLTLAMILSRGPDEGVTSLMISAKSGDITNVERIIREGDYLDDQSDYGWTALMFASWQGKENVVRLLVEAGADIDVVSGKIAPRFFATSGGYPETSAIYEAISNQHYSIALYLLDKGVSLNANALAVAGARGTPELLKRLVNSGTQVNTVSDSEFYRTPLSAAARHGQIENMDWLLENGADPNLQLPHTSNLLQAVRGLQPQAVTVLLEAGAEIDAVIGSQKTTALREAIYTYSNGNHGQKIQIVEILLKNGADSHYRPDEHSRTLIEQINKNIKANVEGSRNPELNSDTRERYRRSLEENRIILSLLTSYQN